MEPTSGADAHLVRPYDSRSHHEHLDNTLSPLVGVALMGQAKGKYTFFSHLKWTPAIALGYAASILLHMWINARTF